MLSKKYVIGVDGGGTKTTVLLADLEGNILARSKTGSSHPRNLGTERAMNSAALAIEEILKKIKGSKNICSVFLGLPAMEEEFKFKRNIVKKELLKHKKIALIFKGKVTIGSDQLVGFRSGTAEKDGIVLIAGSGSVCHGWEKGQEVIIDSCGYLGETSSAFFVGQNVFRAVLKELDGRGKKTLLTKFIFKKAKVKNKEFLMDLAYSGTNIGAVSSFAIFCRLAAERGDKIAENILIEAGKEAALSAKTAIKKLNFQNKKFPLILIGSMFNSEIFRETAKKEIKKFAARAEIIRPKAEPATGAVKLALEQIEK